jgi:predicted metal-binding membrane protein
VLAAAAPSAPTRDRAIALASLTIIAALGWSYLIALHRNMATDHAAMDGMVMMPTFEPWGAGEVLTGFVMWAAMMVAMMTPSAAPLVLVYGGTARGFLGRRLSLIAGYLLVWTAFSALAALAQGALHNARLLVAGGQVGPLLASGVLMLAGAWQLTPLKQGCLVRCRSPVDFLVTYWREGRRGAFAMGVRHGVVCLGCCWALMLVLFAAGVMNLLWVALLAGWVLVEKVLPAGPRLARIGGAALLLLGAWDLVAALLGR